MKTTNSLRLLNALSVLFTIVLAASAAETIPLHQAVRDGKVKVKVTGLGGSTGDAIQVTASRLTPEALRITLASGTVFTSTSGKVQNMAGNIIKGERTTGQAYRPGSEMVLSDDREHTYVVEAYCLDFHKDNPTATDTFTVSPPDPRVADLMPGRLSLPKTLPTGSTQKVIQSVVWMERDGATDDQLRRRFPVSDDELKLARQMQTLLRTLAAPKPTTDTSSGSPTVTSTDLRATLPVLGEPILMWTGKNKTELNSKGMQMQTERMKSVTAVAADFAGGMKKATGQQFEGTGGARFLMFFVSRMSFLFEGASIKPTVATNALKRLDSLTPETVKAWKSTLDEFTPDTAEYAVAAMLLPIDGLYDKDRYSQTAADRYLSRLKSLSKDAVQRWLKEVDQYDGNEVVVAMTLITLDRFFDGSKFNERNFKDALDKLK